MHINLQGRVAIVTGAARGIGRDLVRRFAEEGVRTVALDVNESGLADLGAELAGGPPSLQLACDVTDAARIGECVAATVAEFGQVDILVNNAGITAGGAVEVLSQESWQRCHDVNLTGPFLLSKAVVPHMKERRWGRIINASSFAAIMPTVGGGAYGSSKAAIAHFSRVLAGELGPWGITVNAYAPGMIPTQMNHFDERPPEQQEKLLDMLTLRRWGSTEDIANLVCFLSSEQAAYITGTLIDVSGGKYATQVPRLAYDNAPD
jgi:3-oxoacyl-[acyl-carrier protein] reductase